jgi:GNAT superfamily N-acetyltransferase
MNIRRATIKDESAILALLKELLIPGGEVGKDWEDASGTIRRIIDNPELGTILVADEDGEIAGITTMSFPFAIRCEGVYSCIEENIVDAGHRGKGVGGKLLKAAIAEAAARGCDELQVNSPSEMGLPLYTRNGFEDNGKALKIKLPPGSGA